MPRASTWFAVSIVAAVGAAVIACSSDDDSTSPPVSDAGITDATTDQFVSQTEPDTGVPVFDASAAADAAIPTDDAGDDDAAVDAGPPPVVACDSDAGDASDAGVQCPLPKSTCADSTHVLSYSSATCGSDGFCQYDREIMECPSGQTCGQTADGFCGNVAFR